MAELIINFAPTGMVPTKQMTQHVPVTPDEIVADVFKAADLGASIIHLHARDEAGQPTWRKEVFAQIIRPIRALRPDLILCVTTSGRNYSEFEYRSDVLDLEGDCKPDMASLTLGSLNFVRTASPNSPEMIASLLGKMNDRGIKPELEVFDFGMMNYAQYLLRKGLLQGPLYFNILLGNIATAQGDLMSIAHMLSLLPDESIWALAGIGDCQHSVTTLAMVLGGNLRIGLEDNIYFSQDRAVLATNEMLVGRAVQTAQALGLTVATPTQVRHRLGLTQTRQLHVPEPHVLRSPASWGATDSAPAA